MAVQPGSQRQLRGGKAQKVAARQQPRSRACNEKSCVSTGASVAVMARTSAEQKYAAAKARKTIEPVLASSKPDPTAGAGLAEEVCKEASAVVMKRMRLS
jgi:hypothetical protein